MRATSLALLACVLAVRAAEVPYVHLLFCGIRADASRAAADPLAPAPEASAAVTAPGGAYGAAFATPTAQAQALPPTLFNRLSKIAKVTLVGGAPDSTERDLVDRGAGIERLTDANWADMVVNGNPEDTWLVIIDGQDPMSPMYVEGHRNASRLAKEALQAAKHSTKLDEEIERLKHIRWGRLDYASEPNLCTRWWIWRPPYLLWATDNGKTLRFLKPSQVRPDGDNLHKIMTSGQWDQIPVWNSTYGPGGDRAWLAEYYITVSNFVGSKTSGIPNFMWMLLSGAISQSLLQWFHKKDKRAAAKESTQPAQKRKIDTGKLLERVREQMALRDEIQAKEKARLEKEGKAAPAKQPTPVAPAGGKGKASGSRSTGGTPVNRKKRAD